MSETPLRICFFSSTFSPVAMEAAIGPGESSSTEWLGERISAELLRQGCQVAVIASLPPQLSQHLKTLGETEVSFPKAVATGESPSGSLRIFRLGLWKGTGRFLSSRLYRRFALLRPANTRRLMEIVDEFRPHVLHLHEPVRDMMRQAVRMKQRHGVPLVISLDRTARRQQFPWARPWEVLRRRWLTRELARHADGLLCLGTHAERFVLDTLNRSEAVLSWVTGDTGTISEYPAFHGALERVESQGLSTPSDIWARRCHQLLDLYEQVGGVPSTSFLTSQAVATLPASSSQRAA